jgi:hypothetical protein
VGISLKRVPRSAIAALVLAGLLVTAGVAAGAKQPLKATGGVSLGTTFNIAKTASGRLARTPSGLLGSTSTKMINVMIKYDVDATASYTGGVKGLKATSPSITHKSLMKNRIAVAAYQRYANHKIQMVNSRITSAVPAASIGYWFENVYGGVSARVPANSIASILALPGVAAVQRDPLNHPLDDNTAFIGAATVWPKLGGDTRAGSNVVVGVIDTGIWPEHPMLDPTDITAPVGGLRGCEFGDGSDSANLGNPFACNNKLIGAYAKTATYMSAHGADGTEFCDNTTGVCSPRDSEGHGTHTLTTAAGDCVQHAVLYGVDRGPVCGIAPGAHVEVFRVCLSAGCFGSDSVAAVQQAIHDGVNVINFSVSGGGSPYTDPVELAFLDATNAGISVNASAGNSGPTAGTSDHGGPWTTTVGASTGPRGFVSTLHLTADGGASLDVPGVTLTNGITSPTPVVLAATLGGGETAACAVDAPAGSATGKIVVCARGGNGRIDKGRRVLQGGAAGMILYNQSAGVTDLESDSHYLPAIQTQYLNGAIANFMANNTNVMATWGQGTAGPAQADVMASFSSRGPLGDWIKPDVTVPGVQVLAGWTPAADQTTADNGPAGNLFAAIAGTSMSSPHSAGSSAIVKSDHPTWTPAEIKSALMTSATQAVTKEDGSTPADPFDMGAGRIQVDKAINPTVVFDENYADFQAAGPDVIHRVDLNIPSVDETTFAGELITHRTAINVSGHKLTLRATTVAPAGVTISVNSGHVLNFLNNGKRTFSIKISAPDVAPGQYFGSITLHPKGSKGNVVYIPVAFFKKQGAVTMTNTCASSSIRFNTGRTTCTVTAKNFAAQAADTSIDVGNRDSSDPLSFYNVLYPASMTGFHKGAHWDGTLSPALPPQVNSITDVTGTSNDPIGGYLSLTGFGGDITIPGGDDAITNVNVPTFYYGGEAYNKIGVVTDGYVVLGGGTGADVNYFPQTFPSTAHPNNVVAPFWTDLITTSGSTNDIKVNVLTDGDSNWIIIDFQGVKNFSNSTTHTGEIWIRDSGRNHTGPASEQVTMVYDAANAAAGDPGSAMNWGAENRDGTSGKNIASAPADGTDWAISVSPPQAGGSVSFSYDLGSKIVGSWIADARMTDSVAPGTTIVGNTISVHK